MFDDNDIGNLSDQFGQSFKISDVSIVVSEED